MIRFGYYEAQGGTTYALIKGFSFRLGTLDSLKHGRLFPLS